MSLPFVVVRKAVSASKNGDGRPERYAASATSDVVGVGRSARRREAEVGVSAGAECAMERRAASVSTVMPSLCAEHLPSRVNSRLRETPTSRGDGAVEPTTRIQLCPKAASTLDFVWGAGLAMRSFGRLRPADFCSIDTHVLTDRAVFRSLRAHSWLTRRCAHSSGKSPLSGFGRSFVDCFAGLDSHLKAALTRSAVMTKTSK